MLSLGEVPSQHLVKHTRAIDCSLCIAVLRLMPNTIAFSTDNLSVLRLGLLRLGLLLLCLRSRLLLSRLLIVQMFPYHVRRSHFVTIPAYVDDVPRVFDEVQIVSVIAWLQPVNSSLGNDVVLVHRAFDSAYAASALYSHVNSESGGAHYLDPLEKATCSVVLEGSGRVPNPGRPKSFFFGSLRFVKFFFGSLRIVKVIRPPHEDRGASSYEIACERSPPTPKPIAEENAPEFENEECDNLPLRRGLHPILEPCHVSPWRCMA